MKACTKCGVEKPLTDFTRLKSAADGLASSCSLCSRIATKESYQKHKAKRTSEARAKYAKNRESEIARCDAWNKANPDRVAANMRASRLRNPGSASRATRRWREKNPESASATDRNKRLRRRGAPSDGTVSSEAWSKVIKAHKGKCFYCGKKPKQITMDHFVALAVGGVHSIKNVRPACAACNSSKNDNDPIDFAIRRGRLCW